MSSPGTPPEPVWQEPPPAKQFGGSKPGHTARQRELDAFAAVLRQNPGRYALVGQVEISAGGTSYRRRGLEATTRKRPDGRYDLYVRAPNE